MKGDMIKLTIPREQPFNEVAHLVIGGVAARLNLTFESIDDLETALEAVLEHAPEHGEVTVELLLDDHPPALHAVRAHAPADGEVTVELVLDDGAIVTRVGPFSTDTLRAELDRDEDVVGLRRILDTVVDRYELGGDGWLEMTKTTDGAG